MKKYSAYLPLLVLLVLAVVVWLTGWYRYFSLDSLRQYQLPLTTFIADNFLLAYFLFIGVYFAVVALSIPGATFLTLCSGFFFGQWFGTLAAVLGASLGAGALFISAKMASSQLSKRAGAWLEKMQDGFKENAFSYLLTLRLIPIFPFVAVNIVSALMQIPLWLFFIGTFVGIIPGTFVYTSIGVAMQTLLNQPGFSPQSLISSEVILSLTGLGVLSLLPVLFKLWKKRKKNTAA